MSCSDSSFVFPFFETKTPQKVYIETFRVTEKNNGHSCRSVSEDGLEITHTREMTDGRLFLYCGDESSKYEYFQINNCPFCGYKAKQQILK